MKRHSSYLRSIKADQKPNQTKKSPSFGGANKGVLSGRRNDKLKNDGLKLMCQQEDVHIKVGYGFSRIVSPGAAITLLAEEFSARARNAQFTTMYQRGLWDGKYSMVNKKDGSFGTGMLDDILRYLEQEVECRVKVDDLRTVPEKMYSFSWEFPHPLRDVQVKALKTLATCDHGIIHMPTGSGKSLAMANLTVDKGLRTIICVPSKELLYQTAEVMDKNIGGKDKRVGLLGDGHWPDERSSIVVAMYPSLVSLRGKTVEERSQFIETMGAFDLLICDECHKVCSNDQITKTWETVMDINTYYRYGFSATPFEKKDTVAELLQRSAFGNVCFSISMDEAREEGYVTPFTVYMLKPKYPKELTRFGTTGLTWQEAHEKYLVGNETRNNAVLEATRALLDDGRKVLVVAQRIAHNEYLAKLFAEAFGEENVYLLHGQLDSRYRKKALAEYKARKTPCVMVASSVGNDGIDIPDISGLVLAHGGKSFFQNVQRTGRGLRATAGKNDLMFIDFDDSELGRWFAQHTNKRRQYYMDLGARILCP